MEMQIIDFERKGQQELAALKQRFGLDKQEAYLKTHANTTLKEFAAMLFGRNCQPNLTTCVSRCDLV